jgi:hypothetical protein
MQVQGFHYPFPALATSRNRDRLSGNSGRLESVI